VTCNVDLKLAIPLPEPEVASLPLMIHALITGEEEAVKQIPPPFSSDTLSVMVQFWIFGLQRVEKHIPAPEPEPGTIESAWAKLALMVQSVMNGEEYIRPKIPPPEPVLLLPGSVVSVLSG